MANAISCHVGQTFVKHIDTNEIFFNLSFFRMPFDYTASPVNFFAMYAIEVASGYTAAFILAIFDSFFLSICWYVDAAFTDLLTNFRQIDSIVMNERGRREQNTTIADHLRDTISFHGLIHKYASHISHNFYF